MSKYADMINAELDLAFKQGWAAALEEIRSICKSCPVIIERGTIMYLGEDNKWNDILTIMCKEGE